MAEHQQLEEPPPYLQHSVDHKLPAAPTREPGSVHSGDARYGPILPAPPRVQTPNQYQVPPRDRITSTTTLQYAPISQKAGGSATQTLTLPAVPTHSPSQSSSPHKSQNAISMDSPNERRAASASFEDPDDRMAAEALCGLGKVGSNPSPTRTLTDFETPLQYYPIGIEHTQPGLSSFQHSEPLLSLLTSSHPWLGGTLNGSISAYSSTKSYSPRFIQYGAGLVENTVESVGRATGVEGGLRRLLEPRQSNDLERLGSHTLDNGMDTSPGSGQDLRKPSKASSADSLPLYDDNRSPAYSESNHASTTTPSKHQHHLTHASTQVPRSWPTQLMISTSGLGAAQNEASLRSLKLCLNMLSNANNHIRSLMEALKRVLQDYDDRFSSSTSNQRSRRDGVEHDPDAMAIDTPDTPQRRERDDPSAEAIASRIRAINAEIWATLKSVVNTVSRYTGGALPENASVVVRWQLLSVPQRWQRAVLSSKSQTNGRSNTHVTNASGTGSAGGRGSENESHEQAGQRGAVVGSANAMLAFAVEGLEMMEQVGGVVDSTIGSAERWLESMGRRSQSQTIGPGQSKEVQGQQRLAEVAFGSKGTLPST